MNTYNILHITSNLKKNGPAFVVFDIASGLNELNQNVFVASSDGELSEQLVNMGVKFIKIPINRINNKPNIIRFSNYLKNGIKTYKILSTLIKKENIDIINSHQPIPNIFAKLLSRKYKIPFITTSHNIYEKGFLSNTYNSGDIVVAVSDKVLNNTLELFKVPKEKAICIPNGINPSRLEITEKLKFNSSFIIGTVAGLRKQKSLDIMIKAFKKFNLICPDARLVICGEGSELNYLKQIVNSCDLENRVIFLGFRSDIANVISAFDIFALSSSFEGLPISMLEALVLKKPVVATKVGGIPEVIVDKYNGLLVDCNNIDELAQKFCELYNDVSLRDKISSNGYKTVIKQFSYKTMALNYLQVYSKLIQGRKM